MVIWARLAQEGTHLMFPYLELAKHYEHSAKDYVTAIEYTLMAQTRASNVVERAELEHRLKRVRTQSHARFGGRECRERRVKVGLQIIDFAWPGAPASIGEKLGAIGRGAEEAGIDSLWVMDHFFQSPKLGAVRRPYAGGLYGAGFRGGADIAD